MEYLDERFPHPPLLPVYPVQRALSRLWISRVEKEWSSRLDLLMLGKGP
jgi:RNA polymerase-associated protein